MFQANQMLKILDNGYVYPPKEVTAIIFVPSHLSTVNLYLFHRGQR